jgi:hypothetical protein
MTSSPLMMPVLPSSTPCKLSLFLEVDPVTSKSPRGCNASTNVGINCFDSFQGSVRRIYHAQPEAVEFVLFILCPSLYDCWKQRTPRQNIWDPMNTPVYERVCISAFLHWFVLAIFFPPLWYSVSQICIQDAVVWLVYYLLFLLNKQ